MTTLEVQEASAADAPQPTWRPDTERAPGGSRRARTAIVAGVTGAVALVVAITQAGWGTLRIEPLFDEMWRLDLIRTAQPFEDVLGGVTPIPPGWVGFFRVLDPVLGESTGAHRLTELLFLGVAVAMLVVLLHAWCRPRHRDDGSDTVALAMACASALSIAAFPIVAELTYFNQYFFELAYAIALTTCCVLLGRHRLLMPAFLVAAALAPLFVIAPLPLLPPLFVVTAWWAATADPARRTRRLVAVGASAAVSTTVAIVVYLGVYRGMGDADWLKDLWAGAAVSGGTRDGGLVSRTFELVGAGVFGELAGSALVWQALAAVTLVSCFATGAVTITRRWVWYPFLVGVGWVCLLVGGAITDGPVTPVRVTIGFYWIVFVTIALGFFRAIAWAASRVRASSAVQIGALAGALVLVVATLWSPRPLPLDDAFARGLLHDLDTVVASPSAENLVITYHFMAHAYAHDRLVNRAPEGREYVVLGPRDDQDLRLWDDVDARVRRHLPDGGTLWCVVPYAAGPQRSLRACRAGSGARELVRYAGAHASIVGYAIEPRS